MAGLVNTSPGVHTSVSGPVFPAITKTLYIIFILSQSYRELIISLLCRKSS